MMPRTVGGPSLEIEDELRAPAFHVDPYATYRRLREESPVHFSRSWNGFVVSGYGNVKHVLEQPLLFSSANRVRERMRVLPDEVWEQMQSIYGGFEGFFWSDPPEYTVMRESIGRAFRPHVAGIGDRVEEIVDRAIDAVAADGQMEVIRDVALPLPATVIFEILGIAQDDRDRFRGWAEEMIQLARILDPETAARALAGMDAAVAWVRELLEERTRDARDDLLSALAGEIPVAEMSDREARIAAVTLIQFMLAGHETTTSLIGNGLMTLLSRPDQACAVAADPARIAVAVEEMLRYESPIQYVTRRAAQAVELEGTRIPAGALVMASIGSANRDPEQFPQADEFDAARRPNRHLAFGFNAHFCLGAPLARLEARIAFERLLGRLDGLELIDPQPSWRANPMFRGLVSLPVRFARVR